MIRRYRLRSAAAAFLVVLGACAAPSGDAAAERVPSPPEEIAAVETAPEPEPEPEPEPAPEPSREPDTVIVPDGVLTIHMFDVGQGDAMLLTHPAVTMLIDTGRFDRTDVVPLLRRHGVERIDLLVVTHPHADHIGQFDRVMQAFSVDEVWWSGSTTTTRTFERAVAALEASTARYEEPRAGAATTVGPLGIEVLHPAVGDSLRDLNDASIALRITFGDFRIVTTGDAERAAEARMVARFSDRLPADVLRLGHHGSSTSTTPDFLAAVAPSVAMYSAGANNQYGHPHDEVLARLDRAGVTVYGTATNGTVTIVTDGTGFDVRTER